MYENSDSNYLVYLMKSRTLAEFLSREEYVEKVTNYDKVLLNKYQQVLDEVTIARQKAEEKQREVTATKNSLKFEKEKLEQLSDEKTRQIKIYQGLVADNRQNVASYAAQIADQEKEVEAILREGRDKISQSEKSGDTVQIMPTNGEYAWPLPGFRTGSHRRSAIVRHRLPEPAAIIRVLTLRSIPVPMYLPARRARL